MKKNKSLIPKRLRPSKNTVKMLNAMDEWYRTRREKYFKFVESVQGKAPLEKAEAWLQYVAENDAEFGDQEALVYLVSRGRDCSMQISQLISNWKECEKRVIASCGAGIAVHVLETGRTKIQGGMSLAEARKIENHSPYLLRDFWSGDRIQGLSIDATMLRTVDECGIGGFDPWWRRLAKETTRDLAHGGQDPLPSSFWLFNMCRSRLAMTLMKRTLERALDGLEVISDEAEPWTFRRGYDDPSTGPVDNIPYASSIIFANHILRHDNRDDELVKAAIGTLQKHQLQDGSWPLWATPDEKPSIEATAMAMHAIALENPKGASRMLDAGRNSLIQRQDHGGHWTDPDSPDPVYLTVLVLDAIELANGGKTVTFGLPGGGPGDNTTLAAIIRGNRKFTVALSYPGEFRHIVGPVADDLTRTLGKGKVFYDKYFEAELAVLNLDDRLQSIYHDHADLLVVFLCKDYATKEWCRLEWRAIKDLIKRHRQEDVLLVRFDKVEIPGIFSTDGHIDGTQKSPPAIAELIRQRLRARSVTD